MSQVGLFGGAFDPPHNGHVELARRAVEHFGLDRLIVIVTANPGHRKVYLDPETRLRLARAAFEHDVVLDHHERTIDLLREWRWEDPIVLIGADQFSDFLEWKEPEAVLECARLGVATRPGFPRVRLDAVLRALSRPDRVEFFEIRPLEIASTHVRARVARGESIDELVPPEVSRLIRDLHLYRPETRVH